MKYERLFEISGLTLSILTWMVCILFNHASLNCLRMATWWVMTIQLAYFSLILVPHSERFYFKDRLLKEMRHVGRIMSVLMSFIFWSVFFYDRELILPRHFDVIPGLNILQHLVPPILFFLDDKMYSNVDGTDLNGKVKFKGARLIYPTSVFCAYAMVVMVWYLARGTWPYAFMASLTFRTYQMTCSVVLLGIWLLHKYIPQ